LNIRESNKRIVLAELTGLNLAVPDHGGAALIMLYQLELEWKSKLGLLIIATIHTFTTIDNICIMRVQLQAWMY